MRSFRIPFAAALLAAVATSATAQSTCPMQTTQHVPENISVGPMQNCSGLQVEIIEVTGRVPGGLCPTWMVYTPPHDIAVPSTLQTYVDELDTLAITMVTFECKTRWFLFVPIGTSCVATQKSNIGYVRSMIARPCQTPQG